MGPPPIEHKFVPPPIDHAFVPPPMEHAFVPPPIDHALVPPPIDHAFAPPRLVPPPIDRAFVPPSIADVFDRAFAHSWKDEDDDIFPLSFGRMLKSKSSNSTESGMDMVA